MRTKRSPRANGGLAEVECSAISIIPGTEPNPLQHDLRKHAEIIRDFLSASYPADTVITIYARLSDELREHYCIHDEDLPFEIPRQRARPLRLKSTDVSERVEGDEVVLFNEPLAVFRVCSRSVSSTSAINLELLHRLNSLGYSIQFCINPIRVKRCQKAVRQAYVWLAESDDAEMTMDDQRAVLSRYGVHISSMLDTGNKSLHALIKASDSSLALLTNPDALSVNNLKYLQTAGGAGAAPNFGAFRNAAQWWERRLKEAGLRDLDHGKIVDCAALSRLPGLIHPSTGRVSQVISLNPDASWDWMEFVRDDSSGSGSSLFEDGPSCGTPLSTPSGITKPILWEQAKDGDPSHSPRSAPSSPLFPPYLSLGCIQCSRHSDSKGAIDDAIVFLELMKHGLPGRGTRRSFHGAVFTMARIMRWSDDHLASIWTHIINRAPLNTAETDERAVEDIRREWETVRSGRWLFRMPDCGALPTIIPASRDKLETAVKEMGCLGATVKNAAGIISKVLYPLILSAPGHCMQGTAHVYSKDMDRVSRNNRKQHSYIPARDWLMQVGFMTCTCGEYVVGEKCRQYAVNIPLIIAAVEIPASQLIWEAADDWELAIVA